MLLRFFGVALKDALVLAPGPEHFAFEAKFYNFSLLRIHIMLEKNVKV